MERALEVIREKQIADANRLILDFPDAGIQVLNGRYGPYITDKTRNAKIPKDRDPKTLTLPECQSMLAAAPARTFGKWGRKNKAGGEGGRAQGCGASRRGAESEGCVPTPGRQGSEVARQEAGACRAFGHAQAGAESQRGQEAQKLDQNLPRRRRPKGLPKA